MLTITDSTFYWSNALEYVWIQVHPKLKSKFNLTYKLHRPNGTNLTLTDESCDNFKYELQSYTIDQIQYDQNTHYLFMVGGTILVIEHTPINYIPIQVVAKIGDNPMSFHDIICCFLKPHNYYVIEVKSSKTSKINAVDSESDDDNDDSDDSSNSNYNSNSSVGGIMFDNDDVFYDSNYAKLGKITQIVKKKNSVVIQFDNDYCYEFKPRITILPKLVTSYNVSNNVEVMVGGQWEYMNPSKYNKFRFHLVDGDIVRCYGSTAYYKV